MHTEQEQRGGGRRVAWAFVFAIAVLRSGGAAQAQEQHQEHAYAQIIWAFYDYGAHAHSPFVELVLQTWRHHNPEFEIRLVSCCHHTAYSVQGKVLCVACCVACAGGYLP